MEEFTLRRAEIDAVYAANGPSSSAPSSTRTSNCVRASRTASPRESKRWPEIAIVLLSSRAFHIHSRRLRPTGLNSTFTGAACPSLSMLLSPPMLPAFGRRPAELQCQCHSLMPGVPEPRWSGVGVRFGGNPPEEYEREDEDG